MKLILVMALGLIVVAIGGLYLNQERMIFPAPSSPVPTPDGTAELVEIETPDGERLAALWHAPEENEPTVLFLHGNATAIANLRPMIRDLADAGFGVLAPAWRGYPGSSGSPSEAGLFVDAEAAFDFADARGGGPIAIYGQSLGSGPAVHLATVRDAAALVLEAPYDSVLAVARRRMPFLPVGQLLKHPFRSDQRIGAVTEPILIVHGDNDGVIPDAHGRALHALAPAGARFVSFPGANHFTINPLSRETVIAFIREAVAKPGQTR